MGQYFRIVNLTKKQYINPWDFDDGPKLMEFGQSSGGTLLALAVLTANGNGRGMGDLHLPDYSPLIKKEMQAYNKARDARSKLTGDAYVNCPHPEYPDHTPSPLFDIVGSWAGDRIVTAGDSGDRGRWITKAQTELVIANRITNAKAQFAEEGRPWTAEEEVRQRKYGADLYYVAGLCYENVSAKVLNVIELCDEGRSRQKQDHFEFVRGWITRQVDRDYWAHRFTEVQVSKKRKRACWDLTCLTAEMLDSMIRTISDDRKRFNSFIKWLKQQKLSKGIAMLVDCYKPNTKSGNERHDFNRIQAIIRHELGGRGFDQVRRVLPDAPIMQLAADATSLLEQTMLRLGCNRVEALLYLANEIAQRAPASTDEVATRERSISLHDTV